MAELVSDSELFTLSKSIGERLLQKQAVLATAESCTGGWVAKCLTDVPGSSVWFERGFVTYTNQAKQEMLGVASELIQQHGAVSEETVRAMAEGALHHSTARFSLAISGIAGPGGATPTKPVGLVWFAWAERMESLIHTKAEQQVFSGDRESVRRQAVACALKRMFEETHER